MISFQFASNSDSNQDTFQSSLRFASTSKHFGAFENRPKFLSHLSSNSMAQSAKCNHHFLESESHFAQYTSSISAHAESLSADAIVQANELDRFSNSPSKREVVVLLPLSLPSSFFSLMNSINAEATNEGTNSICFAQQLNINSGALECCALAKAFKNRL
jgi:hypothetical protein